MIKKIMNWLNKTKGQEEFEKFQKEIQTPEISKEEFIKLKELSRQRKNI